MRSPKSTSDDRHLGFVLRVAFLCLTWYCISATSNVIGKLFLRDFPYPTTRTIVQLTSTVLYLIPTLNCFHIPKPKPFDSRYYSTVILPLAIGKFLASVSSHVSIWKVPVSYAHTVKATMPLWVVLLSRLILREKQSWSIYFSLVPIMAGVYIATVTEISFDLIGLMSALVSTFLFSLQNIFSKKVLREHDIHHLRLLQTLAQLALCLFVPFWVLFDGGQMFYSTASHSSDHWVRISVLALCDGFLAFAQNMVAFTMLSLVTPVSYSVANASKRIVVIAVSIMLLRNPVSVNNLLGMSVAILGVFMYNKAKFDQRGQRQVATVLPFQFKEASLIHGNALLSSADEAFPVIVVAGDDGGKGRGGQEANFAAQSWGRGGVKIR